MKFGQVPPLCVLFSLSFTDLGCWLLLITVSNIWDSNYHCDAIALPSFVLVQQKMNLKIMCHTILTIQVDSFIFLCTFFTIAVLSKEWCWLSLISHVQTRSWDVQNVSNKCPSKKDKINCNMVVRWWTCVTSVSDKCCLQKVLNTSKKI